ncbi:MAG: DNA polymerase [Cetobacterium sp.]
MYTENDSGRKGFGGTKSREAKDPNKLTPARIKELALLPEPSTAACKERPLCYECGLYTDCASPFVREAPVGWTGKLLLLFGQRPSQDALDYVISLSLECGYEESDLWFFDAVACGGRKSTTKQLRACRPFFVDLVLRHKPQSILAFGDVALRYATDNGKLKNITENRGRSFMIPGCEKVKTHVYCTYDADSIIDGAFFNRQRVKEDFLRVRSGGLPRLSGPSDKIPTSPTVGVDTEFMPDGKVVTLSVSDAHASACSDISESAATKRLLSRVSTARTFVGHQVTVDLDSVLRLAKQHAARIKPLEGWLQGKNILDTIALARMVDENRPKGGYKLENLLRSSHHTPAWKQDDRVTDESDPSSWPKDYRVERCRLDAWASSVLAKELRPHVKGPLELTHRIIQTLRRIYHTGAFVDLAYTKRITGEFFADASKAKRKLLAFASRYGMAEFSPTNDNHLRELLFEHCGLEATEKTKTTGVASVNKTFLKNNSKSEVVKTLLEFNTADKRYSTYGVGLAKKFLGTGDPRFAMLRFRVNPLGARTGRRASDKPNAQNWPKDVRKIIVSRFADGVIADNDYCFSPTTKILCSDLRWIEAKDIKEGQELIAFPENDIRRKYQKSYVEKVKWVTKPTVRVVTGRGNIIVSDDHMFLAQNGAEKHYRWTMAKDLKEGARIPFLSQPWEEDLSRDAGYLAGIYDGEGWISGTSVGFAQNKGPVLDRVRGLLQQRGFPTTEYGKSKLSSLHIGPSLGDRLRFLGTVRPQRLLAKHEALWLGKACASKVSRPAVVMSVQSVSTGEPVVAIQTSTRTLIANGFFSHNCKLEVILFAFIAREWKLLEFFLEGNGYIAVGKELFNKEVREDTDEYRSVKSTVLGVQYGMGAYKLAYQLWNNVGVKLSSDWEEHAKEAQRIRQRYLDKFPGIPRYIWNQKRALLRDQQVSSITGRVRHLLCPYGEDTPGFGHLLNQAINFPIQSLASDVTGSAMIDVEEALLDKYKLTYEEYHWRLMEGKPPVMPLLINEVHDDLVYDMPQKGLKANLAMISEIMADVPTLRALIPEFDVPLNTGQKIGSRWGLDDRRPV